MSVAVFPLGPLETNCYIVSYEGQAVAIDVGGDPAPVSKYLKEHGLELKAICITHMHFDHLYGVAALAAETHATVYTPEKDKVIASTVLGQGGSSGFPAVPKFESVSIEPGNKTEFAGLECKVLSVPGHTPGSVAYYFKKEKCVFVGDTLFLESIGRTDFPFSSHEQLVTSIRSAPSSSLCRMTQLSIRATDLRPPSATRKSTTPSCNRKILACQQTATLPAGVCFS